MNTDQYTNITVKTIDGAVLYQEAHKAQDSSSAQAYAQTWSYNYAQSRPGYGVLEGLVFTRIDSFKNFAKDIFMPTVVNLASQVENVAGRVFSCLFAAILDLISLPIRFLAFPICAIYQACKPEKEHPLTQLIARHTTPEQLKQALEKGAVSCEVEVHTSIEQPANEDEGQDALIVETTSTTTTYVALKRIPGGNSTNESTINYRKTYALNEYGPVLISSTASRERTSTLSA